MPVFKRVRLINPHKRKKKAAPKTRKRNGQFRRAAARRRNPQQRRRQYNRSRRVSRPSSRATKKNPMGEELILLANPKRKSTRKRKTNPSYKASRRRTNRRRSNPHMGARRYSRRRHNPVFGGAKNFAIEGGKAIVSGAIGGVATRAIVQGVLGDKNTGAMGYLANLAVALGGGFALWKFTKSYSIAIGFAVGGSASTVQRIWSEKVSMTAPAAAAPGLSDMDYSSNGLGGVGLSGFVNSGFALPSVTGADGSVQPAFSPQLPAVNAASGSSNGSPATFVPNTVARFAPRY